MKIKTSELSSLRMAAGNEKRYPIVIHNGTVKEWVGIGWIELRKATDDDCKRYPEAV
jgi:hypothetical protein